MYDLTNGLIRSPNVSLICLDGCLTLCAPDTIKYDVSTDTGASHAASLLSILSIS